MSVNQIAEGFKVFIECGCGGLEKYAVKAKHDEILLCGVAPNEMTTEQKARMEAAGWSWDEDGYWRYFT